jgi:hypothetical protein
MSGPRERMTGERLLAAVLSHRMHGFAQKQWNSARPATRMDSSSGAERARRAYRRHHPNFVVESVLARLRPLKYNPSTRSDAVHHVTHTTGTILMHLVGRGVRKLQPWSERGTRNGRLACQCFFTLPSTYSPRMEPSFEANGISVLFAQLPPS